MERFNSSQLNSTIFTENATYQDYLKYESSALIMQLCILSFFGIFFWIYFLAFIIHILRSIFRKGPKVLIYWIDYGLNLIIFLALLIGYGLYLKRQIYFAKFEDNIEKTLYVKYLNITFFGLFSICLSHAWIDVLDCILVFYKVNRIVSIKVKDTKQLTTQWSEIKISKTTTGKMHLIEVFIIYSLYTILITLLVIRINEQNNDKVSRFYYTQLYSLIVLSFLQLLTFYQLKYYKAKLMSNNYFNSNLTMQAIYNINCSKIIFNLDFITYKSLLDFIVNLPFFLYCLIGHFTWVTMVFVYVIYLLYFFFLGTVFWYTDKTNKVNINNFSKNVFRLKNLQLSFGEKEKAKWYDEYLLDLNWEETNWIGELDFTSWNETNPLWEMDSNIAMSEDVKDYQGVNYFIIYKLLHHYFNTNAKSYQQLQQIDLTQEEKESSKDLHEILREVKYHMKFPQAAIWSNTEDHDFFDDFNKSYLSRTSSCSKNININDNKYCEFILETFLWQECTTWYPHYKIKIEDILYSLDPASNKIIANKHYNNKISDLLLNSYSTHDNFLMFEIYEFNSSTSLNKDKIKAFGKEYMSYFLDKIIKEKSKTFLPMMIGVFHIKYFDYDKIVVLYKNPIAFIQSLPSELSMLLSWSEVQEHVSVLSTVAGDADINSNEIKNKIKVNEETFKNISKIISKDVHYIKKVSFASFFKLNVLILGNCNFSDSENDNDVNTDISNLNTALGSQWNTQLCDTVKEHGSHVLNKHEMVSTTLDDSNKLFTFKIYFSELFRTTIDPSLREIVRGESNSNKTYSKYLKHQLLKLLAKNSTEVWIEEYQNKTYESISVDKYENQVNDNGNDGSNWMINAINNNNSNQMNTNRKEMDMPIGSINF